MTRVVIIGGSIAGVHCAESLRLQGFAGEVLILAQEAGPPYDRPPLTKEFLRGELDAVIVRGCSFKYWFAALSTRTRSNFSRSNER